jgi:uncharacterized protein (UPF0212 family)
MSTALEKLATEPEIEIEAGPPICPHCGKFDPPIQLRGEASSGRLSEFVLTGQCDSCHKTFFVVTESYSMHTHSEMAVFEIREREKAGFFKHVQNKRANQGTQAPTDEVGSAGMRNSSAAE